MINLRKITSLVMLLSTLILSFTGIILFIAPHGKIAYWANWEILGLSKGEYTSLHSTFFVLFLLSFVLHIYFNFNAIKNYLSNKAKELVIFTKEMVIAVVLTVIFFLGTLTNIAPFSTFLSLGDDAKEYWAQIYGEPPFNHAELSSLKVFIKKTGLDENTAIENLKKANIAFDSIEDKLIDVAKRNKKSPNDIYEMIEE